MDALTDIVIPGAEPVYRGKVRDIYDVDGKMALVASDRVSAFDVVFNEGVPGRGVILTQISNHWFEILKPVVANHLIETEIEKMPSPVKDHPAELGGRTVLVKKCERIDFECIVRGYLMGSGHKEYQKTGEICGVKLPEGLKMGSRLPEPIFTPSTKADEGHDINVSYEVMEEALGSELSSKLRDLSIKIFQFASEKLYKNGIILADTKFEFGFYDGEITLIDEVLTPDSSRYWKLDEYEKAMADGTPLPSMDKQILRDYLETLDWNKQPPPPQIPQEIIDKTLQKYQEIERIIQCIIPEK